MTGLAIMFVALGIGVSLFRSGTKPDDKILLSSEMFLSIKYIRLNFGDVDIVYIDGNTETLFSGTEKNAMRYYTQLQQGYQEWLANNKTTKKNSNSKVIFE